MAVADGIVPTKATPYYAATGYNWTGFYAGGRVGYAWGSSNWTSNTAGASNLSGTIELFQPFDVFKDTGSFSQGLQAGYNYMLPNRIVVGAEADVTFPGFPNSAGISIGGISNLMSPTFGAETFSETVLTSGTVRGRIGYAPGSWLFYATGGFAWTYDRLTLTQLATGASEQPFLWRLGFAAGAGVEAPVAPHWTARLEYLFTDYGNSGSTYLAGAQRIDSNFALQELRAGLNYQFGNAARRHRWCLKRRPLRIWTSSTFTVKRHSSNRPIPEFARHTRGTTACPAADRAAKPGMPRCLPAYGCGGERSYGSTPRSIRASGSAIRSALRDFRAEKPTRSDRTYPYGRLPRAFIRQTIDLGGETQKVEAGTLQFAGSQTANRLVLTVGKLSVVDIFDTNKYAHDPRTDFMNWALVDTAIFDYAAEAWGYTYGAAAEWYQGNWTVRGGLFDLSAVPNSPDLDPSFSQVQWVGEIERRYELWGHPGKIAVNGFLTRGRMGTFADAIALAAITGGPADIAAVRHYQSRGGIGMNIEQEITPDLGAFLRAGWADGNIEPYEFTDVDSTVAGGVSLNGKRWGRPDDTIGVAGVINAITGVHQAFFNAGGLGILVGDGQLPHPGLEQIIETYYSYALTGSVRLTADYQLVVNPGYNTDRGPVNVFAGRLHWQF